MKKILLLLTFVCAVTSCDKFFHTDPQNFLHPDSYYTDQKSVETGLMGVYQIMVSPFAYSTLTAATIYSGIALPILFTTSDLEYFSETNQTYYASMFNFTPSEPYVISYWGGCYVGVSRANNFIWRMETTEIPDMSDEDKNAALGEAYFLRGFYYWHLAANFGGVPLVTDGSAEITSHRERSPLKDVYAQILSDMIKAEGLVYDADKFSHSGRVTRTLVQAMLARVCLYMAGHPLNDTSKYADALAWARKVRDSGLHDLDPDYAAVFTRLMNDRYETVYRESMWEAEFKGVDGETPRTDGRWGSPNGVLCRDKNIGVTWSNLCVSRVLENYYAEEKDEDGAVVDKRYTWNVCPYDLGTDAIAVKRDRSIEYRNIGKFRKEAVEGGSGETRTSTNFPIMRYSDVLLMLAEAANEMDGPTDEAIAALNVVRSRAGVRLCANNTADEEKIALSDKESFREFIKKERARELCFEATRRLDLIRWGHLVESVKYMSSISTVAKAKRPGNYISEKHNLLPIPSMELNGNMLIEQNPGW